MGQDQLREIIVRAAIPLIVEYDTLAIGRIAQAAGIDEGALLAVFDDKDAVVRACMATGGFPGNRQAARDPAGRRRQTVGPRWTGSGWVGDGSARVRSGT